MTDIARSNNSMEDQSDKLLTDQNPNGTSKNDEDLEEEFFGTQKNVNENGEVRTTVSLNGSIV